jgi:putative PIN family toxin of toxin-antitoxin system
VRVVLDVNVLVSGLPLQTNTPPSILVDLWYEGRFGLYYSHHILKKIGDAWRKPYYQSRIRSDEIPILLDRLRFLGNVVEPVDDVHGEAEDDEDDLVLATAVAAQADFLVTGDKYLLDLKEFRGIPIVSPRDVLDRLLETAP